MKAARYDDNIWPVGSEVKITWLRVIQIVIFSVTIFPIRVVLVLFFRCLQLPFYFALKHFSTESERERVFRKRWQIVFYKIIAGLARTELFCGSVIVCEKGRRAPPEEAPVVIVAPHRFWIDPIWLYLFDRRASPVIAKESSALAGPLMLSSFPIEIVRSNDHSRKHTTKSIITQAKSPDIYPQVLMAPEGILSNGKGMLKFQLGAFNPGVPVQLLIGRIRGDAWDTLTSNPLIRASTLPKLFWLTLCQFYLIIDLEYLPVYVPNREEKRDPTLYAKNVQEYVSKLTNLPISKYSYENVILHKECRNLGLPRETVEFDYIALCKLTGYKLDFFKRRLSEYSVLYDSETNTITEKSLLSALPLPVSALSDRFMQCVTKSQNGLTFEEYVKACASGFDLYFSMHFEE